MISLLHEETESEARQRIRNAAKQKISNQSSDDESTITQLGRAASKAVDTVTSIPGKIDDFKNKVNEFEKNYKDQQKIDNPQIHQLNKQVHDDNKLANEIRRKNNEKIAAIKQREKQNQDVEDERDKALKKIVTSKPNKPEEPGLLDKLKYGWNTPKGDNYKDKQDQLLHRYSVANKATRVGPKVNNPYENDPSTARNKLNAEVEKQFKEEKDKISTQNALKRENAQNVEDTKNLSDQHKSNIVNKYDSTRHEENKLTNQKYTQNSLKRENAQNTETAKDLTDAQKPKYSTDTLPERHVKPSITTHSPNDNIPNPKNVQPSPTVTTKPPTQQELDNKNNDNHPLNVARKYITDKANKASKFISDPENHDLVKNAGLGAGGAALAGLGALAYKKLKKK